MKISNANDVIFQEDSDVFYLLNTGGHLDADLNNN